MGGRLCAQARCFWSRSPPAASQPALAGKRPRHVAATVPATDPAAPYKADRLSSSQGESILNTPGQTTVLTRQVLDDIKATSLRDAMRSTAGVTIGR
jgi:outer membrane receptor for monomeric catechols